MNRQYLGVAETAKLVRQSLKEAFPGIKFGVRSNSYSGGASMYVSWIDGPNDAQVDAVINRFKGAYFDGMIDYKGSVYARLDGNDVSFGADYIRTNRRYSDAIEGLILSRVLAKYGFNDGPQPSVEMFNRGDLYQRYPESKSFFGEYNWSLQSIMNRELSKFSQVLKVQPSATAARVEFAGDDGYGQGTVGMNGDGGSSAYRAIEEARQRQEAIKVFADNPHMFGGVQ